MTNTSISDPAPALGALPARSLVTAIFRNNGRAHVPEVLSEESALRLYHVLSNETPWRLAFNKGAQHFDGENLTEIERRHLATGAWTRARDGFQYFYDRHVISTAGESYAVPTHYLGRMCAFLNSAPFLALMREITGLGAIKAASAEATFYRQGDFFTFNDGRRGDARRLAYYVLSVTPGWRGDWGGIVQFLNDDGHVAEGFAPAFNSLMVFRLPMNHSVSQVAIYGGYRHAIEGWLLGA